MAKGNYIVELQNGPVLVQVAGQGKGRVFDVAEAKISVGRTDNNHIVLPHESVSRVHAYIEQQEDGSYVIFDNESKNGVVVNGEKVNATPLRNGDVIQLGMFALQFNIGADGEAAVSEGVEAQFGGMPSEPEKKGINKRVLIYGGAALVILYAVMTQNSGTENATPAESKTEQDSKGFPVSDAPNWSEATRAKVSGLKDPALRNVEEELSKIDPTDVALRESEQYFRRAQREFSNRNFQRAIDSFAAALSLNKRHPLARYYLDAAMHESEKEAEKHRQTAIKYFESLQYNRAIYHFSQAIANMAHRPNDPTIQSKIQACEKGIELAKQKLQAVELFP